MNQANVMGHLGAEPEYKRFTSSKLVARFPLALNTYRKSTDPDKKPPATWLTIELWDEAAERLQKCAARNPLKGRRIRVTGSLAENRYLKPVGDQWVTVSKIYVKCSQFELIGGGQPSKDDDANTDSQAQSEVDDESTPEAEILPAAQYESEKPTMVAESDIKRA